MEPTMEEKTLAAIGPGDFVLGFQLAGVEEIRETTPETYADEMQELVDHPEVGIIIARHDDVASLPANVRSEVTGSVDPVVIQLGGGAGEGLREKIRSAIGIDLMEE
jgi:V/A-type H+-transporting ATPase subunit F